MTVTDHGHVEVPLQFQIGSPVTVSSMTAALALLVAQNTHSVIRRKMKLNQELANLHELH